MTDPQDPKTTAEFAPATEQAWRGLVDAVLKGAPFAKLESRSHGGLTIEPLYARDTDATAIPGRAPGAAWTVMQRVDHPDPRAANAQALEDLAKGATGLTLVTAGSISANGYGIDGSLETLKRVLDGVELDAGIAIDFNLGPATRNAVREFATLVQSRDSTMPARLDLRASINPIGGFAASGKSPLPWRELSHDFVDLIGALSACGFRGPFAVADGRVIHNAGGSEAQELAFAIASAVEYLRTLESHDVPLEAARRSIYFRLSADAEQFLTMAKFRAARKLWARVEQACGLAPEPALVTAETAWRMMTRRDPYVNMLRTTIAVAAAGLGGADAITVLPHTAPLGLPDAFARRVARNTQLVLLEESNLARVADPAAGSGALEAITEQMCQAAWSAFQEIESAGGAWMALERGLIQQKVAAVHAERETALARRADILTGTNEYPDINETLPAVLDVAPVAPPRDGAATITTAPLPRIRLAEPFEQLRDASDKILAQTGARPKIFLAALGKLADYGARANFAKNFFEAGGIEALEGEGAAAFAASGAALACLCGADKTYDDEAEAAARALKASGARHIYLAGRPGEREQALRTAGVGTFIYAGCDVLATLRAAHQILAG
jgi:methylmalonyl-CoA mutase